MRKVLKLGTLMPLLAATLALAALGYAKLTPNLYDVTADVLLRRSQVEPIEGAGEAAKNRWVWVRDGLALKEELTSDETLAAVLKDVPELAARQAAFAEKAKLGDLDAADQEVLYLESLRRQINVVFNGADESVFSLTLRDRDPRLARQVVKALIGQLKRLAVDEAAAARREAVQALGQKALAGDVGLGSKFVATVAGRGKDRLDDYRIFLAARDELYKTEDDSRVRVLRHPVKAELAWPKVPFLMIAGAILGAALALLIDLQRSGNLKRLLVTG
jgi:uncharacterized protein involved in exopolysaccharide biosynthesis